MTRKLTATGKAMRERPPAAELASGVGARGTGPAGRETEGTPYHHGALREAMLAAAEAILARDGIQGLTLRAAARAAGVSHAAPKNHFGDLRGLLSELAAVGFSRLADTMEQAAQGAVGERASQSASSLGQGYVRFARANPALFQLMFRSERLDFDRPALKEAADRAFGLLTEAVTAGRGEVATGTLTLPQAADILVAWSLVHGLSMLLIDRRVTALLARLPAGTDEAALLAEASRRLAGRD
jgi:AcrR family transcriptional regulator